MRPDQRNPLDESFVSRLMNSISRPVFDFTEDAFGRQSMENDRGVGGGLLHLLTAPFRFLLGIAVFMVQAWASSRPGLAFATGFPAVAVIGGFLFGIWAADFLETKRIFGSAVANFQFHSQNSVDKPEYLTMFAEKMVDIKPESDEVKYELGNARVRAKDMPGAVDVMRYLAPEDRPRFAEAHLWRARYFQDKSSPIADPESRDAAIQKHLDYAIELAPDNMFAHFTLASVHDNRARQQEDGSEERIANLEKAAEHLQAMFAGGIVSRMQLLALPKLVEIQKELQESKDLPEGAASSSIMNFVVGTLSPIAQRNPDMYEVWLMLVRSAVLLKDYDKASEFINDGFRATKSEDVKQKLADLASEVQLEEASGYSDMSKMSDYIQRLYATTKAISFNPRNPKIYVFLLDFVAPNADPSSSNGEGEAASDTLASDFGQSEWLSDALGGAPNPGVIHSLIGLQSVIGGDRPAAKIHWAIAQQQFPLAQIVVNNMIDIGAKSKREGFVDPLPLLEAATQSFPDQPVLQQTQGIYLKQAGQIDAAIAAFESALERLPNLLIARKSLAVMYGSKNMDQEASIHERYIDSYLAKLDDKKRALAMKQLEIVK